jgi:hypothetical protein
VTLAATFGDDFAAALGGTLAVAFGGALAVTLGKALAATLGGALTDAFGVALADTLGTAFTFERDVFGAALVTEPLECLGVVLELDLADVLAFFAVTNVNSP